MATLFFEGFDKGIVFNQLDPTYWSTQFKQYPKYAFGGYLPISDGQMRYYLSYTYNSPNNGFLPSGSFVHPSNAYPAFGSPPGFLALSNVEIENNTMEEFPTYIKLSGFKLPSGDTTYLAFRTLGLESSNSDYSEYPYRHKLFTYNSGDIEQLCINIVKITGTNNFIPINTRYETLALEIQQNNQTLGYFDLNISQIISRYKIASVYSNQNKILTIADTTAGGAYSSVISRWTHLEFSVDNTPTPSAILSINVEDINLPVVNFDSETARELWDTSLSISGFNFDNIRFYNRTYSSSITGNVPTQFMSYVGYVQGPQEPHWYYLYGKVWLIDDLCLIDNADPEPSYWLGTSSRVIQLTPGKDGSLLDNDSISDGILDWTASLSSYQPLINGPFVTAPAHRKSLTFLDNDNFSIETINSGNIDAVSYNTRNRSAYIVSIDSLSNWRETFNEAIGGIKLYNSARKKYLDTKFINVYRTGVSDPMDTQVDLLLHFDDTPIIDSSYIPKQIYTYGDTTVTNSEYKFGTRSVNYPNNFSYNYLTYPDIGTGLFTIEAWVNFTDSTTRISIFDKMDIEAAVPINSISDYKNFENRFYSFTADISGVNFDSFYSYYINNPTYSYLNNTNTTKRKLFFPQVADSGQWYHLAITRNSNNEIICFLNGQSGISHTIYQTYPNNWNGLYEATGIYTNKLYKYNYGNISSNIAAPYNSVSVPYLSIGRGGYIDEYRITSGNRYSSNFTKPSQRFKNQRDDYIEIGNVMNVNKTVYKTYQGYSYYNPATQQSWTVSQLSGILLGVKKL